LFTQLCVVFALEWLVVALAVLWPIFPQTLDVGDWHRRLRRLRCRSQRQRRRVRFQPRVLRLKLWKQWRWRWRRRLLQVVTQKFATSIRRLQRRATWELISLKRLESCKRFTVPFLVDILQAVHVGCVREVVGVVGPLVAYVLTPPRWTTSARCPKFRVVAVLGPKLGQSTSLMHASIVGIIPKEAPTS
jgi:hypothetical protein